MRITLPSGTEAEIARPDGSPRIGLVVTPDIWGLRPLFDDLVAGWARDWGMAVIAVDQYAGSRPDDAADVETRFAAVAALDESARHLDGVSESVSARVVEVDGKVRDTIEKIEENVKAIETGARS